MQIDTTTDFGAMAARRLQEEQVIWLTTVDASGTPQPTPVWFHWNGENFLIYSEPKVAKIRNIKDNARVALSFNTGPHGDAVAVFIGDARVSDAPVPEARVTEYLTKYAEGITSLNLTPETMFAQYSAVILVTPEKMRGWA